MPAEGEPEYFILREIELTQNKIALITDSTCDIPANMLAKYEIIVVPLTIIWGDKQYLDGVELTAEEFYKRLPNEPYHPTTSQPSPQAFLNAYRQASERGAQQIMVITISSAMSGTIKSALQAANDFDVPVHVIDGKNNSLGIGWQVIAAARVREAGGGLPEMLAAAEQARQNMVYYVSLDTMEYLLKGGRIGEATKFLSSILQIKPLIYVKPSTGIVAASVPARSRVRAIDGLFKEFFNHINVKQPMHIAVLHNNALEEAQKLLEKVEREFSPQELLLRLVSPVLGAHTGPRAVALCGYAEE
jgi:DegV family protein with EDD domain